MINFQKKPVLGLVSEPTYIRKEAKDKHNEVTVVMATYAMPLNHTFCRGSNALSHNVLRVALKAASGFQDIGFRFNGKVEAPAFIFTTKAKTERRGDDVPNQELADKLVLAKANHKACVIAERVLGAVRSYYENEVKHLAPICDMLTYAANRELSYIQRA